MATQMGELIVILYGGAERAQWAAEIFAGLNREHCVELRNAAIIACGRDGSTAIHETNDLENGAGALLGALFGGLVGYLKDRPVQGAAIGAAGGYLAARLLDLGFDDTTLRAVAHSLTPDSSALVLAVAIHDLHAVCRRLAPLGGTVLHDTSPTQQAARLATALGQAAIEGSLAPSTTP
jgi:uncharacterized membrane protein